MPKRFPIAIEITGAESSRLCAQGGPFQAEMRIGAQSYMDPIADAQAFVNYARLLESAGTVGMHFVKLDTLTWLYVGRTAGGGTQDGGSTDPLIAMSEDEFVAGYERGAFDPTWASKTPGWTTPEYRRVHVANAIISGAGLKWKVARHLDFEGGVNCFDPDRRDANGRILWRLLGSTKFRSRLGVGLQTRTQQQLWDGLNHTAAAFPVIYPAVAYLIGNAHNSTVYNLLGDSGPFFIPNAASPTQDCPRFDGRNQVATAMFPGQMPNMGWYMGLDTFGAYGTAAFVNAQGCYSPSNPLIGHHQLDSDRSELSARLRFARGPSVLFSDSGDLSGLAPLADLIGMWRGT